MSQANQHKIVVICAPAASGKTRHAQKLAALFGCRHVFDGEFCQPGEGFTDGVLLLTASNERATLIEKAHPAAVVIRGGYAQDLLRLLDDEQSLTANNLFLSLRELLREYQRLARCSELGYYGSPVYQGITERAEEALFDYQLERAAQQTPAWAVAVSKGQPQPGAQLCTKDGRQVGNGWVLEVREVAETLGQPKTTVYGVLTDSGNLMTVTAQELDSLFWVGDYLADVTEIRRKYLRED